MGAVAHAPELLQLLEITCVHNDQAKIKISASTRAKVDSTDSGDVYMRRSASNVWRGATGVERLLPKSLMSSASTLLWCTSFGWRFRHFYPAKPRKNEFGRGIKETSASKSVRGQVESPSSIVVGCASNRFLVCSCRLVPPCPPFLLHTRNGYPPQRRLSELA